ncbi:hypothetical protein FA088_30255, partial [Pseudomonas aeruginosa]|nr:hypothetical protein [Pseudomonas aeruginosa]
STSRRQRQMCIRDRSTADATHMLAPAPVAAPAPRERVTLWQGELSSREGAQGIPEYLAQVEPALLDTLALGQVLEMSLPGRERPLQARLASTHNSAGLPVWRGGLVDGDEAESLTVVRGSLETHINVATLDGSYSIIVDNRSGKTRVIDENDIAARSDPHGDHVDAPLAELPPMPPPAQG